MRGSVTGLYTVLVEGDDMTEPVADATRSILDGHIILSRDLAGANHFPAIDVLNSQSRIFTDIVTPDHRAGAGRIRNMMAAYNRARDLLDVGAYVSGSNPEIDTAVRRHPAIKKLLCQAAEENTPIKETVDAIALIANSAEPQP